MTCTAEKPDSVAELLGIIRGLGLIPSDASVALTRLEGGVSSDIWKVEAAGRTFVVKRALPKLRVAADWHAPVNRNRFEAAWMATVASILPDAVPRVLGSDVDAGLFAMEYCAPSLFPVWKAELLCGRVDVEVAREVGRQLAAIHSRTANSDHVGRSFATDEIFHAIRLEPYLEATARRHPAVANRLLALSRETLATKRALVHGDVSPKNILVGPRGPVFLDAECAWYGDPAFDVAFCLNHLLLKCIAVRTAAPKLLAGFDALAANYFAGVDWEPQTEVEARVGQLLPALLLARVDGKSPVEYITLEADRELVRATALPLISAPPLSPDQVKSAWAERLKP
jgi:aminoglycoside phosphotransferase (APT) family kinase protein